MHRWGSLRFRRMRAHGTSFAFESLQMQLQQIRKIHLYLGLLFAPSIIFFSFSGSLQLFGLHEAARGSSSQPPRWIATMAQVHKDQNLEVRTPPPPSARGPAPSPRPSSPAEPKKSRSPLPLKIFFLFMAVGMIITASLGIVMAFRYNRDRRVIWALLTAGVVLPLLLLLI